LLEGSISPNEARAVRDLLLCKRNLRAHPRSLVCSL